MADDILSLEGRVAFITGASSRGIGSGIAKKFAAHGAKVFLVARRGEQLAKQAASIEEAGGTAAWMVCDVRDEEQVKAAIDACAERFGGIDILVPNAGISGGRDPEHLFETEKWNAVIETNLEGVFYCVKHALKYLKEGTDASIIATLSEASLKVAGHLPYTATKGALLRMVPWYAKNFGPMGIRVNGIIPGLVDTDMTNPPGRDTRAMLFEPHLARVPLRRESTIEDCANAALFLASGMAHTITAQIIAVDSGDSLME